MTQNHQPPTSDEPGTGTQHHVFAAPPNNDRDLPCSMRINGTKWKVGHDYIDTDIGDVARLTRIIGRSSWCTTEDAADCPPELIFEYERYDSTVRLNPADDDFDSERFIERYTRDPPIGAPDPPW